LQRAPPQPKRLCARARRLTRTRACAGEPVGCAPAVDCPQGAVALRRPFWKLEIRQCQKRSTTIHRGIKEVLIGARSHQADLALLEEQRVTNYSLLVVLAPRRGAAEESRYTTRAPRRAPFARLDGADCTIFALLVDTLQEWCAPAPAAFRFGSVSQRAVQSTFALALHNPVRASPLRARQGRGVVRLARLQVLARACQGARAAARLARALRRAHDRVPRDCLP
jgi:hypothetical protein